MENRKKGEKKPVDRPAPRAMSIGAVASTLGLSEMAIYDSVKRGELPHLRIGRRILIATAVVERLLAPD